MISTWETALRPICINHSWGDDKRVATYLVALSPEDKKYPVCEDCREDHELMGDYVEPMV